MRISVFDLTTQDTCFGSSIIEIWAKENGKTTKAVFTGDLGNNDLPLLDSPTMIESADYLPTFSDAHPEQQCGVRL